MSLVVNLVVLAEGAAVDARGSLTLVAVNPQSLVADQLPAQFAPIFVVAVEEHAEGAAPSVIVPGRGASLRVRVTDPDGNVVFHSQLHQAVPLAVYPNLPPRMQLLAQVSFPAQKVGEYEISGRIAFDSAAGQKEEVIEAERKVLVMDAATLRGEQS